MKAFKLACNSSDAARMQHNATLAAADGVLAGVAAHRTLAFAPPLLMAR